MGGDPGAIMTARASAFGASDLDTAAALDGMIKGATQPAAPAQRLLFGNAGYVERAGLAAYRALGYIPYEENVSGTLMIANGGLIRSEEHTSELQSLMRISYAVFCLKKKKT